MSKFSVGFYKPSSEFRRMQEHVAVMDEHCGLTAITGSADFRDREQFTESLAFAAVYSVAWEALTLAMQVARSDHPLAAQAQKIEQMLVDSLAETASASPQCSMFAFREAAKAFIASRAVSLSEEGW